MEDEIIPRGTVYTQNVNLDTRYFLLLEDVNRFEYFAKGVQLYLSQEASSIPYWDFNEKNVRLYDGGNRITRNERDSKRVLEEEMDSLDDFIKTASGIIKEHGDDWHSKEHWKDTPYKRT